MRREFFGALVGVQEGRKVEIFNSYELVATEVEKDLVFDLEFLDRKQKQFKQVFPTYDILGWYSTGSRVQDVDLHLHKQIEPFNEAPLYLMLDTNPGQEVREVPITIYESEVKIINEKPQVLFGHINYKIETGDAERLAVDHVARTGGPTDGSSQLTAHLFSMHNAIKMLKQRVSIIKEFLDATMTKKLKVDHSIIRRVASLCNMLPAIDSATFRQEFINEYNDALLVAYLATIMKASNNINELIDKFNVAYDRHSGRSRRGFF